MAYWALVTRPDRGRPTLHGWWAPVALRYIKRWGPAAQSTRFAVSRKSHRQTLDRSKRARSQRREAPLTFTVVTATPSVCTASTSVQPLLQPSLPVCCLHQRTSDGQLNRDFLRRLRFNTSTSILSPYRCSVLGLDVHVLYGSKYSSA